MTTSRNNTIMSWMAYTEFFYPGCELQPGYFYPSMPELFYYTLEDGACIGAAGIDAYVSFSEKFFRFLFLSLFLSLYLYLYPSL